MNKTPLDIEQLTVGGKKIYILNLQCTVTFNLIPLIMKKITSKNLSKRLTQYGALTAAIGGIAEASGQVIYTDITDVGGPVFSYELNLDNDGAGNHDFTIEDWKITTATNSSALKIWIKAGNAVAGSKPSYVYPFALDSGAVIDAAQPWQSNSGNSQWQTMQFLDAGGNGCQYASKWCDVTDKFLGLRFDIGGNTHYGWARLDAPGSNDTSTWTIKDYAYEATPDSAITAGSGILEIDENDLVSKVRVVSLNKSIGLYHLPEVTNYRLFSMTGQEVLKGVITESTHVIEAKTLASGVYIVALEDYNTKAVMRKKIVL